MNKYLKQAKQLHKANFRIYGLGNFDITIGEIAEILKLLSRGDFELLANLYEKLERKRMG